MMRICSRLAVAVAACAMTALLLAGCAGKPPALEPTTAEQLQADVLGVTEAAAAGDLVQARSELSHAEANLRTAAASGQVAPERSAEIQAAINLVSADLSTAIDAAEAQAASAARDLAEAEAAQADADAKQAAEDAKQAEEDAKDNQNKDCKGKDCDD
ncbi:hypothetical protein [Cryobacterium roopkundense]|uniref:Mucin-associated surface protein n=1 Tax=Cryobacterium roopkundense TaxID=1001240 RepID=A0A7W8ZU40_9MICO|nr:hypothetical protein [Cryobacterium roopkundense]MBB5640234.1 hypothetical protein [Cryobacterium roopkundense]